jgi:hypothetical protein
VHPVLLNCCHAVGRSDRVTEANQLRTIVLPSTLATGFEVTGAGSARALCRIDTSSQLRNINPITSVERCGVNGVVGKTWSTEAD